MANKVNSIKKKLKSNLDNESFFVLSDEIIANSFQFNLLILNQV